MYTLEEIKELLKDRLTKKRFQHSLNVADEARRLAERWNGNPELSYAAGLLHDVCKDIPLEEQRQQMLHSAMSVSPEERVSPALWHAIAGAWYVCHVLGYNQTADDHDLCAAIRYHTVARAGMSRLEEIVYLADLISADRTYKDVDKMRRLAYLNLDQTMLEALRFSITDVVRKGGKLPCHTTEAYNQYVLIKSGSSRK